MTLSLDRHRWLHLIKSHLHLSAEALFLQHERMVKGRPSLKDFAEKGTPPEGMHLADGLLFALALGDLHRVARTAQKEMQNKKIAVAIEAFDKAIPAAKDFRDVLEHWDAYGKGKGNLQKQGGGNNNVHTFLGAALTLTTLELHVGRSSSVSGLALDVEAAIRAAEPLIRTIQDELVEEIRKP